MQPDSVKLATFICHDFLNNGGMHLYFGHRPIFTTILHGRKIWTIFLVGLIVEDYETTGFNI